MPSSLTARSHVFATAVFGPAEQNCNDSTYSLKSWMDIPVSLQEQFRRQTAFQEKVLSSWSFRSSWLWARHEQAPWSSDFFSQFWLLLIDGGFILLTLLLACEVQKRWKKWRRNQSCLKLLETAFSFGPKSKWTHITSLTREIYIFDKLKALSVSLGKKSWRKSTEGSLICAQLLVETGVSKGHVKQPGKIVPWTV